jgi:hypothetical protein
VAKPVTTYPILNVISPTTACLHVSNERPHFFPSPSNSPFDPDLRMLTFSMPPPSHKTHTPFSSISSMSSLTNNTTSSSIGRHTYYSPMLSSLQAFHCLPISANVDQRRVMRITSSGRKMPSSLFRANAARIVTWRRATAMGPLHRRSNARLIYQK